MGLGKRRSTAWRARAATRYTPWANLPQGKVANRAITTPRCRHSSQGIAAVPVDAHKPRPVVAVRNSRAMKPMSMGACAGSPCSGWRRAFSQAKPAVPAAKLMPPTTPKTLGKEGQG